MFKQRIGFTLIGIALLLGSVGCRTVPVQDQDAGLELESAAAQAAESFASSPNVKGKRAAIGDFLDPSGQKAGSSGSIAGACETSFAKASSASGFTLVSRRNFNQIAEEWKLNLTGAVDPSSAKKVGALLGVDVLVVGDVFDSGQALRTYMRGIDTESGKVLWAESVKIKKDKTLLEAASGKEEKPRVKEGEIKVKLWSDKQTYSVGESMTIHFKTNRDCYLTLIDVGTSGKVTVLYPNRFSGGSQVIAGKKYSVPGKDDGYKIIVGGPGGLELVRAVATLTPLPFIDADFSKTNSVFRGVDNTLSLTRDLSLVTTTAPVSSRGEGLIRIELRE